MIRPRFAVVAALGGGALAALIPVLPAVGQSSPPSSPIILRHTGTLADRGVVANVATLVTCAPGDPGSVSVSLSDRSGKDVAFGFTSVNFTCSGGIQTVRVAVPAENRVFTPGSAYAQASLFDQGTGTSGNTSGTVHLTR